MGVLQSLRIRLANSIRALGDLVHPREYTITVIGTLDEGARRDLLRMLREAE